MDVLLSVAFAPQSADQLIHSYLMWMAVFLAINMVWDAFTKLTPPFDFHRFTGKIGVIMGATSFCSSLLVLGSLLNKQTALVVGGTPVPLIIAGGVGALLSLQSLCPYDEKAAQAARAAKAEGKAENK